MSGIFGSSQYLFGDTGFYGHEINQSARFDKSGSAYLTKTPSSATNQRTWTWSGWFKNTGDMTSDFDFFTANGSGAELTAFMVSGDEQHLQLYSNNGTVLKASADLRDTASWYHIICRCDTTQSTASDRLKFYVNGTETAYQTDNRSSSFAEDFETGINDTVAHYVGCNQVNGNLLNGYLAEVHFTDGVSNAPSAFGETKEGVWIPKAYTGSHGTNGYYLKFDQTGTGTASASTIGADSSGNNNHYTTSGFASIDSNRTDSPTNNFATWNQGWAGAGTYGTHGTIVNGALELSSVGSATNAFCSQTLPSSGKYYAEMRVSSLNSFSGGLMQSSPSIHRSVLFETDGTIDQDNSQVQSGLTSYTAGNTIGILADMDAGTVQFKLQNSNYGSAVTLTTLDNQGDYTFMCRANAYVELRTDSRDFAYSIPDGYTTLSTANYPEPSISPLNGEKPANYFDILLYTGNATDGHEIDGTSFQPDWLWGKHRSGSNSYQVFDSTRGVTKNMKTNTTDAEGTVTTILASFDADGFTLNSSGGLNKSANTFVAWLWKANGGTTSSNSDGDITSTVQANTEAGFSIVTYASTGSTATVGHGLTQAPEMIIAVQRAGSAWSIYHEGMGNDKRLRLESNVAQATSSVWGNTTPTSSVFTQSITSTTNNILAYCFHSVEGYSMMGKFTGNGGTDGTYIYTGFRPAWVLIKNTADAEWWSLFDIKRSPINENNAILSPNDSNAEYSAGGGGIDLLSNGFKLRSTSGNFNGDGDAHIFLAFAEMPFKYANGV